MIEMWLAVLAAFLSFLAGVVVGIRVVSTLLGAIMRKVKDGY